MKQPQQSESSSSKDATQGSQNDKSPLNVIKESARWVAFKSSLASFVANMGALTLYPLEAVKTRLQASDGAANNPLPKYKGITEALSSMYRNEGITSLYRGVMIYWASTSVANISFFSMYSFLRKKLKYSEHPTTPWAFFISSQASIFAAMITHPFWTLKTRVILHMRVSREVDKNGLAIFKRVVSDMYRNEGLGALYKGFIASLWLCSTGIVHMTCYEFLKKVTDLYLKGHDKIKNVVPLFTGSVSRLIATTLLYPLTTIRTRLQKKQYKAAEVKKDAAAAEQKEIIYKGNVDCIKKIWRNEGFMGFYKGLFANLLRVVPANGIFFLIYEYANKKRAKW